MLMVSLTGLLYVAGPHGSASATISRRTSAREFAGGWLGWLTFGQTHNYNFGFSLLGNLGATIVYVGARPDQPAVPDEFPARQLDSRAAAKGKTAPEHRIQIRRGNCPGKARARNWKNKNANWKRKSSTEKSSSGLGADGLPVPEPTVRDLSVPQAKGPRFRKTTCRRNRRRKSRSDRPA